MSKISLQCAENSIAKQTRCPICGSIEIKKTLDGYECPQCRTKFNNEEHNIEEYEEED
jgi:tRNA(Ile2) C34 agmatinyltransferase TiaS